MELTASRFIVTATEAIDIATAEAVSLRRLPPLGEPDERRWVAACSTLAALWHEDMPSLLDYGHTGDHRFESYEDRQAVAPPLGAEAVRAFLGEAGLVDPASPGERITGESPRFGLRLLQRDAFTVIREVLEDGRSGQPRCVVCTGDRGAGLTTLLRLAAAEGRRRGYVSVSVRALDRWPALFDALRERHALVLCDSDARPGSGERWLLRLSRRCSAGHVLVRSGRVLNACADVVLRLAPFEPEALAIALSVYPPNTLSPDRIRRAAARSGGIPGAFLEELRGIKRLRRTPPGHRELPRGLRVAEARAAYLPQRSSPEPAALEHPWADMLERADRLAASGLRAAAQRDLREVAGAASRRHLASVVIAANTRLAALLAARGALDAAEALLCGAHTAENADEQPVEQALGLAAVKMERGAFEAAEAVLRAARPIELTRPTIALAECLGWQGRYADLQRCLAALPTPVDATIRAAADCLLARAALAEGDLPGAARLASGVLTGSCEARSSGIVADAHEVLARIHAALGDRPEVERRFRGALQAARRAGLVARVPRIRAMAFEALHAAGATPPRRAIDRLLAVAPRMTPLSRACAWRMAARIHPVARERQAYAERLASFISATGAVSLELDGENASHALAKDVTDLVAVLDAAPDHRSVLRATADWMLRRLDARAVQFVDAEGLSLAGAGANDAIAAARRVLLTRAPQPPWGAGANLEAAAPSRMHGRVVGAVAVRWRAGQIPDRGVSPLIAAAAALAAPALAGVADSSALPAAGPDAAGLIGRSAAIARVREAVGRAGPSPFPVLVEGESGTGKELVARAIHAASARRQRACVAVNCAALGDDLLDAELFGHARGAFTGAHADRPGLFEQADGGTLFLDEVSELSLRAQAKLLRALQEGEVRRVGENHTRRVDVRIVAASNRRLDDDVVSGRFRQDLLFRLAVVRIAVPALRDRAEDVPLLIAHYWKRASEGARSRATLTGAAVDALSRYRWPGNVRELQNVIAAIAVQVPRGRIGVDVVRAFVAGGDDRTAAPACTLEDARRRFERDFVAAALARCGGRHGAAARELGLTRQGLAKLLRRLEGIT